MPARVNCVPSYCVRAAGLKLTAERKSCGLATLVPPIPPEAGIRLLPADTPYGCAEAVRGTIKATRLRSRVMERVIAKRIRQSFAMSAIGVR